MEKQIVESGDSVYKVITLDDIIGKKKIRNRKKNLQISQQIVWFHWV